MIASQNFNLLSYMNLSTDDFPLFFPEQVNYVIGSGRDSARIRKDMKTIGSKKMGCGNLIEIQNVGFLKDL